MCYMSALYAGISRVLYAVDRNGTAAQGFDYRSTYALFKSDPRETLTGVGTAQPSP
jgi:guanine deaminase